MLRLLDEIVAIDESWASGFEQWAALYARSNAHEAPGHPAAARADADRAYGLAQSIGPLPFAARVECAGGALLLGQIKRIEEESRRHEVDELTRRDEQQTSEPSKRSLQQRWLLTPT